MNPKRAQPKKLSSDERERLRDFEDSFDMGLYALEKIIACMDNALICIRDEKLYRGRHRAFSDYERKWRVLVERTLKGWR